MEHDALYREAHRIRTEWRQSNALAKLVDIANAARRERCLPPVISAMDASMWCAEHNIITVERFRWTFS